MKTVVIPVAGYGTRMLPATKAIPKEMLIVVDKPLIQYAVEEVIEAGFTEIVFITSPYKSAIENHFDRSRDLEYQLQTENKRELLKLVKNIVPSHVSISYVRQGEPRGLGHAIHCAKPYIHENFFGVLLPDEIIVDPVGAMQQLIHEWKMHVLAQIGVQRVTDSEKSKYGIVDTINGYVDSIIEKPTRPVVSNLAIVGRYILPYNILDELSIHVNTPGVEVSLTDSIENCIVVNDTKIMAYEVYGQRFDCGSKLGYAKAFNYFASKHEEIGKEYKEHVYGT